MGRNIFKARIVSIILIAVGYGWAGGHYIPVNSPPIAYAFQLIVIIILLILSVRYLSLPETVNNKHLWSIRGLSIFSIISLLINIANIIHGAMNAGKASYGSHNSFADLVPVGLIIMGTCVWLTTLLIHRLK